MTYHLTNQNATIRNTRFRLEQMKREKDAGTQVREYRFFKLIFEMCRETMIEIIGIFIDESQRYFKDILEVNLTDITFYCTNHGQREKRNIRLNNGIVLHCLSRR